MTDIDLDAIEARANAALNSPSGQSYDAGVILSRDVPALVAALREARAGWYQNRDKADLCDAMIAERDEARAATARVRALCAGADDSEYTTVFAAAVLAALDARDDPSATTDDDYYVIEVDPETARLNVTDPSATADGGAG